MNDNLLSRKIKADPLLSAVLLLIACLGGLLIWTVWRIPRPLPGLGEEAAVHLAESGVDNPVTAVLLNFRGYDTLLEVTVLLLAAITIWSITHAPFPPRMPDTSPVQAGAVRLLVPLICLTGGYFIWQGSYLAGGAFQGGAILSSALVLLLISDFLWLPRMHSLPLRLGLVLGPLVFMAAAVWGMLAQGSLLQFPPEQAGAFLLLIETACGISIGLTLAAYFAGGRPLTDLREEPYSADRGEDGPDGD